MNFVKRVLVRKLGRMHGNTPNPDFESIEQFATRMGKTYHTFSVSGIAKDLLIFLRERNSAN